MKKAACAALLLAGAVLVAEGINGISGFAPSVHAEEKDEEDSVRSEYTSKIDTSIPVMEGSRIAVVSKNTEGEFWKLVEKGMEDAVADINEAYGYEGDDKLTMTFEGPSDEQDVESQVNTLDAVISENPTVVCVSASDMDSLEAQLEAAAENGIPVIAFDSNVSESELVTAFRGTDNNEVGKIAGEKMAETLTDGGKIAVFSAQEKTESSQKRVESFKESLSDRSDITIVRELYMDQVDDMSNAIKETLESFPDLAGVFCSNADVADLYLSVDKDEENQPLMIGVDATTKQQEAVKNGSEQGIVSQAPYDIGYETILAAAQATVSPFPSDIEETILLDAKWIDLNDIEEESVSKYLYN